MNYADLIRDIPDFPKAGIIFKDLTTLWKDGAAFRASIDELANRYKGKKIDKVVGAESRGFIVGAPIAYILGAGFIPVRKPSKLPAPAIQKSYALEYGEATLCIHKDAISKGDRVLIADDLLATGGTISAMIDLVEGLGGEIVECAFLVELDFLGGRQRIKKGVHSLVHYN